MQFFIITPHSKGNGYALTSDSLSYPLWYRKTVDAAKYAKWVSRAKGCRIETRDASGDLLWFEENPPGDPFAY
jgi:hypothetical protein